MSVEELILKNVDFDSLAMHLAINVFPVPFKIDANLKHSCIFNRLSIWNRKRFDPNLVDRIGADPWAVLEVHWKCHYSWTEKTKSLQFVISITILRKIYGLSKGQMTISWMVFLTNSRPAMSPQVMGGVRSITSLVIISISFGSMFFIFDVSMLGMFPPPPPPNIPFWPLLLLLLLQLELFRCSSSLLRMGKLNLLCMPRLIWNLTKTVDKEH